jgi:hypothetical protein
MRTCPRVIKLHQKGTTMPSEDYKALTLRLYAAIGEVFRTGDSGQGIKS